MDAVKMFVEPAAQIGEGAAKIRDGDRLAGMAQIGLGALGVAPVAKFPLLSPLRSAQTHANRAASGTGAYLKGATGGTGLGKLEGRAVKLTEKGIDKVENHLAQFGSYEPNAAMIERLRAAHAAGRPVTGADAVFYTHELAEGTMMGRGTLYEAAHSAALCKYEVSPFSVYHPEVIAEFPEMFNPNWAQFWGITR